MNKSNVVVGAVLLVTLVVLKLEAGTLLPAPRIMQKGGTCWAATGTVVAALYNKFPDDRAAHGGDNHYMGLCEAINIHNWIHSNCTSSSQSVWCKDTPPSFVNCCNYWYGETELSQVCTHGGDPGTILTWAGLDYDVVGAAIDTADLEEEVVNQNRPVPIRWILHDPFPPHPIGNHDITIVGYYPETTDICVMNGWTTQPEGGFWCANYFEIYGWGQSWDWVETWKIHQSRNTATSAKIMNAPELPAGGSDPAVQLYHDDGWSYYLPSGGTMEFGPYVIDTPDDVNIGAISGNSNSIILKDGFWVKTGSQLLIIAN